MVTFLHERQALRQIIGEMEAALEQPVLQPGALQGWQATFREINDRMDAPPEASDAPDGASLQHLQARAHDLLAQLMRSR